jgi:FkbM family methyltransferase
MANKENMRTIKQSLQTISRRVGVYHRLQASSIYDLYWRIADKRLIEARNKQVDFYRSLLLGFQRADLIFDIGANHGTKSDIFLRLGARVVAVEPDELCQQILREKFQRFRITPKPVVVVGKALSDSVAETEMWIDGPGSALNTLSRKWAETLKTDKARFEHTHSTLDFSRHKTVETTTLEQLIDEHGLPYFVKIDVEGYEVAVLRGLKRTVPFLSFEVNLPEFRPEGVECIKRLAGLTPEGRFNYAADFERGLALGEWLDAERFLPKLERCTEKSIEVFWKTPARA